MLPSNVDIPWTAKEYTIMNKCSKHAEFSGCTNVSQICKCSIFLFANLQIPPTEITMRAPCKITWFWSKIHFLNISLTNEPNHWGCDHCILSSTFSNMFLENIQNGFLLGLPGWWDVSVWDSLKTWDEYNNLSLSA